jgi:hypothetical protein
MGEGEVRPVNPDDYGKRFVNCYCWPDNVERQAVFG